MGNFRSIFTMVVLSAFVMLAVACSSNEPPNKLAGVNKESQPTAAEQKEQTETSQQRS